MKLNSRDRVELKVTEVLAIHFKNLADTKFEMGIFQSLGKKLKERFTNRKGEISRMRMRIAQPAINLQKNDFFLKNSTILWI